MRDKISIERAKKLHPAIAEEVIEVIDEIEKGFPEHIAVRIVQGLRTFDEQDALYQQGRTTKGPIVTNAKAGSSYHNYGLALDFAILYDKDKDGKYEELSWSTVKDGDVDGIPDWTEVAQAFLRHGYNWGGEWRTFKDLPHVEKHFDYNWRELLVKHANEDFIKDTKYVNV